jgi:GMP synthase-like glutamine amidotransferase
MRYLNVGETFEMGCGAIFDPWLAEGIVPDRMKDVDKYLPLVDLVVFGGGQDVHPELYGHKDVGSYVDKYPGHRDEFERVVFSKAISSNIPMFGICRGAQLVCALSGGKLIQDVTNHGGGQHAIQTEDGRQLLITSTHHQMMYPYGTEHELVAWAKRRSRHYTWDGKDQIPEDFKEPEVVYFKQTNALGMQGHPEYYDDVMDPAVVYTRELVNKYLLNGAMEDV